MPLPPFLEWLGCVPLMVFDTLSQGPGVLWFPWEPLLWVALVVLIIMNRYTLKRKRELTRSHSDQGEAHGKVCKRTGLTVQNSEEALKIPVIVASGPRLQTLCLAPLNKTLNTLSPDTEGFRKKVGESVPPPPSCPGLRTHLRRRVQSLAETLESHQAQVTDAKRTAAKQTLKTPANIQHLQKKLMDVLNENIHLRNSLELLSRECEERKGRVQELAATRDSLERSHAQVRRELTEKESHLKSLSEIVLKAMQVPQLLTQGPTAAGPLAAEEERDVGSGRHPVSSSEVNLKSFVFAANLKAYEKEKEILCRKLREENQMNYMLMELRDHLQRVHASLQSQNSQLNSENQKLCLKFQVLPELHGEHVKQLLRKSAEEQRRCLETEERSRRVYESLSDVRQGRSFYQKWVKDTEEELEKTTFSCQIKILFYEKRAQESWVATLSAQRQIDALRKENNDITQKLANIQFKSKPFQRGHFSPRGPEVRGSPSHQVPGREGGYAGRSQGSRVPRRFN